MTRTTTLLALSALAVLCSISAWGGTVSPANPSLSGREDGIDDADGTPVELTLRTLDIDIRVIGAVAQVTVDAQFGNAENLISEGILRLALPDGAVVTGYALDVNGAMLDGVLVPTPKARVAFEDKLRRGVDPGMTEVTRSNVFSTRVFPIDEDGRQIRVVFVAPVHPVHGLQMRWQTVAPVGRVRLTVRTDDPSKRPRLSVPKPLRIRWGKIEDGQLAVMQVERQPLSGRLQLRLGPASFTPRLAQHPSGPIYFQVAASPPPDHARAVTPRRLRVYWDTSRSRRDADLDAELELLESYLDATRPMTIDVVRFASDATTLTTVTSPEAVRRVLRDSRYRGATRMTALNAATYPPADRCLLFSDGVVTLGTQASLPAGCITEAVVSAAEAETGYLARITQETGGALHRLTPNSAAQVLDALVHPPARLVAIENERGQKKPFHLLENGQIVGDWPLASGRTLRLRYLSPTGAESMQQVLLPPRAPRFAGVGALWAARELADQRSRDVPEAAIVQLSRRYSVASPAMSFLVLESPEDYVEDDVEPPASYPKESFARYEQLKADHDAERDAARAERLDDLIERWNELKAWWMEPSGPSANRKRAVSPEARPAVASQRVAPAPATSAISASADRGELDEVMVSEVVATANRVEADAPARTTTIEVIPWSADRPYLRALDAALPSEIDRVIAEQERQHGSLPAFYFDIANWLESKGRRPEALEMLRSALDLPTADAETLAIVAAQLLRLNATDEAIGLYEKLRLQVPDRPQPTRDLARALAQRGQPADLERALALLTEVVMTPWEDRDDGIEIIALLEANALIPRLAPNPARTLPLDPRLIALLTVDLRVLLEWNTNATDIDLWVEEPTGEIASYRNPRTNLNGRLSNDMTDGYGPEEYLLRQAATGTYAVTVNVFARDQIKPNGATVVVARLIRDFGRPTQREESIQIELSDEDSGTVRVGRLVVETSSAATTPSLPKVRAP